ncbi:MAG: M28 family peptidase [Gammaproteobacteria bacterium]|nr:M28 family peptidase [Gammaproteobacteria bacterium]
MIRAYATDLKKHVLFLSSAKLEGRLTGTPGEALATQYIADFFNTLGLEPAGDNGTFFQTFDFTAGALLGKNNVFFITNQKGEKRALALNQEWRPLSFSDNLSFETTELVFAGYGITAPALKKLPPYDAYHDLNVKDKYVVVFRYLPEKITDEQKNQLSQYASLRYKAFTAKDHGAKGIIFVSGPNSKVRDELIPLSLDVSLSGADILAVSIQDNIVDELLKNDGTSFHSLQKLQDTLDSGQLGTMPALTGIKMAGQINLLQNKQRGRNVLAKLKLAPDTTQMIVIGAHVDHLGHGELSGSRESDHGKKLIHNGADDNASGVSVVLQSAAQLSKLKQQGKLNGKKDILFAAWSGEELGFLGSSHFVKDFMMKASNKSLRPAIDVAINLDMVGRLREDLSLQGVASSSVWQKLIESTNEKHAMPLMLQTDPYLPTDSTSFYLQGVPSLNFFTGAHDEYHTARDKPNTLNYKGMEHILDFLVDLVQEIEATSCLIDYQQVVKTGDKPGRGLRVYLGTIPDYSSVDTVGVKLSGVAKDSPTEQAGVLPNDVIFELAGRKIHDIYDYTFVLNSLKVGVPVSLVVRRGQECITLRVVARSRE